MMHVDDTQVLSVTFLSSRLKENPLYASGCMRLPPARPLVGHAAYMDT